MKLRYTILSVLITAIVCFFLFHTPEKVCEQPEPTVVVQACHRSLPHEAHTTGIVRDEFAGITKFHEQEADTDGSIVIYTLIHCDFANDGNVLHDFQDMRCRVTVASLDKEKILKAKGFRDFERMFLANKEEVDSTPELANGALWENK